MIERVKIWGCLVLLSIPLVFSQPSLSQEQVLATLPPSPEEDGEPITPGEEREESLPGDNEREKAPNVEEGELKELTFEERLDGAVDLARLGDFERAHQEFNEVNLQFGRKAIVHYNLAVIREMGDGGRYSGDLNEAISEYLNCLQVDRDFLPAHINLGVLYQKMDYLEASKEQYQRALQINPQHKGALFNVAMVLYSQGKEEEALEKLSTLIKIDPDYTSAWRAKAIICERSGDIAGAIHAWKEAYIRETNAKWADYARDRLQEIRGY